MVMKVGSEVRGLPVMSLLPSLKILCGNPELSPPMQIKWPIITMNFFLLNNKFQEHLSHFSHALLCSTEIQQHTILSSRKKMWKKENEIG